MNTLFPLVRGVGDDERLARVVWAHLSEPARGPVGAWIEAHGAVGALDQLAAGELGRRSACAARLAELDLDAVVRGLQRFQVRVVIPGDPEWPSRLDDHPVPPHCLFVRGVVDLAEATERSIAVVGARAATAYGTSVARRLAAGLAERGVSVVSGAAFGIDAAAHEGTLGVDGLTVAALACGLDRPYPTAHTALIRRIAETGAVISEVPLGHAPYRQRFLARNRIIAAMTLGTVVVEAGLRSGSLNTATQARELERPVAMVPGPVTSSLSAGCHEWIRTRGAHLVTDAADVLDVMGRIGEDAQDLRRAPEQVADLVEPQDQDLWSAIPVRAGADLATLSLAAGLPVTATLAGLGRLVALGLVERRDDRWRKVPPSKTG